MFKVYNENLRLTLLFMTELLCKSIDWFLYDKDLCRERVNVLKDLFNKVASFWKCFQILI